MKISPENLKEAIARYQSGISLRQLSEEYHCAYSTLYKLVKSSSPELASLKAKEAEYLQKDQDIQKEAEYPQKDGTYHNPVQNASQPQSITVRDIAEKVKNILNDEIKKGIPAINLKYYTDSLKNINDILSKTGSDLDQSMEIIFSLGGEGHLEAQGDDLDTEVSESTQDVLNNDMGDL